MRIFYLTLNVNFFLKEPRPETFQTPCILNEIKDVYQFDKNLISLKFAQFIKT